MTRSVYTLCVFQNLNPVGFCVICAFCGELQAKFFSAARLRFITPNVCNYKTFGVIQLWTYIKFENPNNQKSKMTNDLNDTLTNHCILRWRQTMGIILLVVLLYVVPTECTDYTEAYGHKTFRIHRIAYASRGKNPQKWMLVGLRAVVNYKQGDTSTRTFRHA